MSNLLDSIRAKMAAASEQLEQRREPGAYRPKKRRQWTRQIIKTTRFDELDWENVRQDKDVDAGIRDLYLGDIHNPEERPGYLNAPELVRDIFMTFLKPVPMQHKKYEVIKDARLNGKFVEQMMALPEWERLHDQTATDVLLSKMAVTIVMDALKEMIRTHREQVKKANEERENHDSDQNDPNGNPGGGGDSWDEETPGKGKGQGPGKGKNGGQGNGSPGANQDQGGKSQFDDDEDDPSQPEWDEEQIEQLKQQFEQAAKEQAEQNAANGDSEGTQSEGEGEDGEGDGDDDEDANLDGNEREFNENYEDEEYDQESDWEKMLDGVDFGRAVNSALKEAADNIEELDNLRKGVGIDDAEWKMMDPTARMKIADKLNNPRMKQIADMVGRMKRFAMSQQQTKIIDAPHEIFTVEMGNDLRRVLRSEFAFLGTPETKIEFYRRYVEGTLLQYKERGHEDVGKGPIICCIDNSGSMSGAPENWAKGVAEALRRICQEQDRDFHAIYFETNRHRERFDFPKGKGPFEKVLAFLGVSAGGGTEFDGVLTEALNKCQTMFDGENKGKADIIFITDGEAYLDKGWIDKFVAERDRIGARIFGIYISAYDSRRNSATKLLEQFCQVVIPVKALEVNDDAAATIFSQV